MKKPGPKGSGDVYVPPHFPKAEMSVLGALLQFKDTLETCLQMNLRPSHFFRDVNAKLYAAMIDVAAERGEAVDEITVAAELERRGELEDVDRLDYLRGLVENVSTGANTPSHVKLILEAATRRSALRFAEDLTTSARNGQPLTEILDGAETGLATLRAQSCPAKVADATVGSEKFLSPPPLLEWDIAQVRTKGDSGWTGGSPKSMKGLWSIEEARAVSTGTRFLDHFETRKARVLYVSEEDNERRFHRRFNAALSGRPPAEIPRDEDLRFLIKAGVRLDTSAGLAVLRAHIARWRPEVVILDHFGKLHARDENRADEVKPILDALDHQREEFGCAFRVIKHNRKEAQGQSHRKGEMLAGSQALFGWGESSVYLMLQSKGRSLVEVEGKDGDTAPRFLVLYEDGKLVYGGEVKANRQEQHRELVIGFLAEHPNATIAQVAEALKRTERTARKLLVTMEKEELVVGDQEISGQAKRWRCK